MESEGMHGQLTPDGAKVYSSTHLAQITAQVHPFKLDRVSAQVPAGQTLLEALGPNCTPALQVWVNGHFIDREQWADRYLLPGDVIAAKVIPQGGDNQAFNAIAQIAVAVAAAQIPGSGLLADAARIGAYAVGRAAVNYFIPVHHETNEEREFTRSFDLTGSRNRLKPYAPVPRVYGKHRVYPPMAAKPYTINHGSSQELRLLLCVGYGPVELSEPRIGETLVGSFDSNNNFTSNGNYDGIGINVGSDPVFYSNNVDQQSVNQGLNALNDTHTVTSAADADELSVDLVFPQGMFRNNNGKTDFAGASFTIEFRATGTSDPWESAETYEVLPHVGGDFINVVGTGFNVTGRKRETIRAAVKWETPSRGQYDVRITRTSADDGDDYYQDCTWTNLKTITHENPTTFDAADDIVLIGMRIKASDQLNGVLDRFNVVVQAKLPVYDPADGTHDWTNRNTWTVQATQNPAWAAIDAMAGQANARQASMESISESKFVEFANWCDTNGFTYNHPGDNQMTVFNKVQEILAAGRGSWSFVD